MFGQNKSLIIPTGRESHFEDIFLVAQNQSRVRVTEHSLPIKIDKLKLLTKIEVNEWS